MNSRLTLLRKKYYWK